MVWWLCVFVSIYLLVPSFAQKDCPFAPTFPKDRRQDRTSLRVATFNVEWLFAAGASSSSPWKTEEEVKNHINVLAKVIDEVDADIWFFEEVQDCKILEELRLRLKTPDLYVQYMIKGTDTATGQNVALFTKIDPNSDMKRTAARVAYPLSGTKCGFTGSPGDYGVSKHFYTTIDVQNFGRIGFFGVHFLAFPDDKVRCVQREAQASVIADLVWETFDKLKLDHVVIAGDCNDFSSTVPDCCNNKPISSVVSGILGHCLKNNNPPLFEVAQNIGREERYTYIPPYKGQIDHILVSHRLADLVNETWIDHTIGQPTNKYMSDHWPLVVNFKAKKN